MLYPYPRSMHRCCMHHSFVQQVVPGQMSAKNNLLRSNIGNQLWVPHIANSLLKNTLKIEHQISHNAIVVFNKWLRPFIISSPAETSSYNIARRLLSTSSLVDAEYPVIAQRTSDRTPVNRHYVVKNSKLIHCDNNLPIFSRHCFAQNNTTMLSSIYARFFSTPERTPITSIKSGGSKQPLDPRGEKHIKIKACAGLYSELAKTQPKLFGSAQNEGIEFVVKYYDSAERLTSQDLKDAPVVCLLHGAPGSYEDFASLIDYLTARNVRVVAPNFPTYATTLEHGFRHSPPERADYLREFFKSINLERIDLLIGHSSSVYTVFEILNQVHENLMPIHVNALGLFSTPSYNLPSNLVPTPMRLFLLHMFDYPVFRPIIMAFAQTIVRLQGIRNRVDKDKLDNLLMGASAIGYSFSDSMAERLKLITRSKIPTFVLIGCNDKIIPMEHFDQLKRDLGITSDDQIRHYGEDGAVSRDVKERNELVNVCQFASGGHYAFQRFTHQVNAEVYDFLTTKALRPSIETTKL